MGGVCCYIHRFVAVVVAGRCPSTYSPQVSDLVHRVGEVGSQLGSPYRSIPNLRVFFIKTYRVFNKLFDKHIKHNIHRKKKKNTSIQTNKNKYQA